MQHKLQGNSLRILLRILQPGLPPTVRELLAMVGTKSPNGMRWHLRRLMNLGLVTWEHGKARTLRPTCTLEVIRES